MFEEAGFLNVECSVKYASKGLVAGDFDVIVYENIRKGIQQYADKLSKGIVEKFPEKFIETRVKIVQN